MSELTQVTAKVTEGFGVVLEFRRHYYINSYTFGLLMTLGFRKSAVMGSNDWRNPDLLEVTRPVQRLIDGVNSGAFGKHRTLLKKK